MFKTIIQPTGIYNVSQIKSQAQSNSSKTPAENIPNTVQDNNKQEKKSEKKTGLATKLILLTFAAIGTVYGLPALRNAAVKKQNGLDLRESEIIKKTEEIFNKGNNTLEKERKFIEKETKALERDKKIFEKINSSPVLNKIKNVLVKAADFSEYKIQRPLKNFFTRHIFSFVKK